MTHSGIRSTVCTGKDCPICAKIAARPERTQGQGSGYVRGMPFWTHVTTSHGRETR